MNRHRSLQLGPGDNVDDGEREEGENDKTRNGGDNGLSFQFSTDEERQEEEKAFTTTTTNVFVDEYNHDDEDGNDDVKNNIGSVPLSTTKIKKKSSNNNKSNQSNNKSNDDDNTFGKNPSTTTTPDFRRQGDDSPKFIFQKGGRRHARTRRRKKKTNNEYRSNNDATTTFASAPSSSKTTRTTTRTTRKGRKSRRKKKKMMAADHGIADGDDNPTLDKTPSTIEAEAVATTRMTHRMARMAAINISSEEEDSVDHEEESDIEDWPGAIPVSGVGRRRRGRINNGASFVENDNLDVEESGENNTNEEEQQQQHRIYAELAPGPIEIVEGTPVDTETMEDSNDNNEIDRNKKWNRFLLMGAMVAIVTLILGLNIPLIIRNNRSNNVKVGATTPTPSPTTTSSPTDFEIIISPNTTVTASNSPSMEPTTEHPTMEPSTVPSMEPTTETPTTVPSSSTFPSAAPTDIMDVAISILSPFIPDLPSGSIQQEALEWLVEFDDEGLIGSIDIGNSSVTSSPPPPPGYCSWTGNCPLNGGDPNVGSCNDSSAKCLECGGSVYCPGSPTASTNATVGRLLDRYVMAVLFLSTNGEAWNNNFNWMSKFPVCSWYTSSSILTCPPSSERIDIVNLRT